MIRLVTQNGPTIYVVAIFVYIYYNLKNQTMTEKRIYQSYLHFVEVHKIHQHEIDSCFGKDYFKKNPLYSNDKCINKLAKHMEMNIKVRTEYPTSHSVQFTEV